MIADLFLDVNVTGTPKSNIFKRKDNPVPRKRSQNLNPPLASKHCMMSSLNALERSDFGRCGVEGGLGNYSTAGDGLLTVHRSERRRPGRTFETCSGGSGPSPGCRR
jgi:hypothetical protein